MVRLNEYEVAPEFQHLDDAAVVDGGFAHAHVLRAVARSSNRLITQGEPLLSLSWFHRAPTTTEQLDYAVRAAVVPRWSRLIRGAWMRPKKPGLVKADVFVHATITDGAVVDLAVQTLRSPSVLRAHEGDANLLRMAGTGAEQVYKFRGIDISPGARERFAFHVRGSVGSAGYVEEASPLNYQTDPAARGQIFSIHHLDGAVHTAFDTGWNTRPALTWAPTHAMVIHDGASVTPPFGNTLHVAQFHSIEAARDAFVYPPPADADGARALGSKFFYITPLPTIRITHISIWAQDRVL